MAERLDIALATAEELPELVGDDAPLRRALARRGLRAEPRVWSDPDVDWSSAPLTLIRSTWGYDSRRDEFVEWAVRVGRESALWNPPEIVRWNSDKRYLRDLAERGVPTVPTVWLERGERADLARLLDERGWDEVVVKPAVSAGARGLIRLRRPVPDGAQAHLERLLDRGAVLVQPFLPSVLDGELSVIAFAGRPVHAVRKVPAPGDFRVQPQYGGRHTRVEPSPAERETAERVLDAVAGQTLYARVDLLPGPEGQLVLVELELIEPRLFFSVAPESAETLVDALGARLG